VPYVSWLVVSFIFVTILVAMFPSIALWLPKYLGY
jgi:TRAP-type C4-dicarboxylate transport system permease large subunit